MYLHTIMFCTLANEFSIPMGAGNVFTRKNVLYTLWYNLPLWAPIFTVITEVWPRANLAVFTNNLIVIIEVVLIEVLLIEGLL